MYCQGLVAGQQAKKVLHERIYLDGLYFTWLYCQGPAKKVLHERVLDLTAAVVFPGSRSPHPLISNRTKNVSSVTITVLLLIFFSTAEQCS